MFDFDSFEGRLPWHQSKWDPAALESQFGRSDVLPAWIADMDFKTVPAVQEAVIEAAKNGMYGYTQIETARQNESQVAEQRVSDTFGTQNVIALLVPRGDYDSEKALLERLEACDQVD